jgi:CBS domain containing-hemolysin-like protein
VGDISDEYDIVAEDQVDTSGGYVIDGLETLDEFTDQTGLQPSQRSFHHRGRLFHGQAQCGAKSGVTWSSSTSARRADNW